MSALKSLWTSAPRAATVDDLRTFLSRRAAFAAQKAVTDYCEVKAGLNRDALFAEASFRDALTACRWESFAAVLSDLLVLAHTHLAPHVAGHETVLAERLAGVGRAILAAEPPPAHRPEGWDDVTVAIASRLAETAGHPPRPPAEVARAAARRVLATLPIHENHRRTDREAIVGAVRFHIVSAWDAMLIEVDAAATAADLLSDRRTGLAG
ncbi:hypothetical protein HL658_03230 [Azospirillum sp. RWY-5-1]|uniref:Uncharacterized protein n=1 Tax=Azospirillum oleiclasticum TaxID=2735135 RepID=A0ABX2T600_9PROT|nr:hypothetical protein [Azospirillum oleiclasticum]NYZ11550.1 hypothetical protein [Azospirillum oleiclasticum]NYZ18711.1 hypothetical protein [Azospirillum oleiclasticum]